MTRTFPIWALVVTLLACASTASAQSKWDPPVTPRVSGTFTGNGKPAKLKFVTVEEHEPFSGKDALTLVFTEKDPKSSEKPSFDAMFNKLGSALILSVFQEDGDVFGCQVAHAALGKSGFSSSGEMKTLQFTFSGGNVSGHFSSGGVRDAFGQKWEVDLTFAAPLTEKMRTALTDHPKPSVTASKHEDSEASEKPTQTTGPNPAARQVPLPADAKNIQFNSTVEQIQCASALSVSAVTNELSAKLTAQGWKAAEEELQTPAHAMLQREKDGGKLTIMIQPAGTGSTIKILTEDLDWSGADSISKSAASKSQESGDDVENAAQKMIQDALKESPEGQ